MLDDLKKSFQEETFSERRARMIPAVLCSIVIASIYTWTFFLINVYTFPNLPLGMDWLQLFEMWLGFSIGLASLGAIATWFTEEYMGFVGGGIIFTLIMATIFIFSSIVRNSFVFIALIMALTLVGISMFGAWGLRRISQQYIEAIRLPHQNSRRKALTSFTLIILLLGLIPGVLGRMGSADEQALSQLHNLLQEAPTDPIVWTRLPVRQVPSLRDHFGVPYVIYARQSVFAAGALDVLVQFDDGFALSCTLPTVNDAKFITFCNEGVR